MNFLYGGAISLNDCDYVVRCITDMAREEYVLEEPRLGRVGYINCLPIFYALEKGFVRIPARIVADHPSRLNSLLAAEELEVTVVSSIAYAHYGESCVVLPDLAIASDGAVWSVALLSRVPRV